MFDLTAKTNKMNAKFGLTVTLFVFLAACSHKQVNNESAELNPIPANEVVDSQYTPSASESVEAPAAKKSHHAFKSKHKKKITRVASHSHKKSSKSGLAIGKVKPQLPPPPSQMQPLAPPTVVVPAPAIASAVESVSTPNRGWMIWLLVAGFAGTLVLGYRASQKGKKGRRLVFNS